jgi:chorismate mutase-like protein
VGHDLPEDLRRRLKPFRGRIDALDDRIMALLAKRFGIVRAVGELKAAHNFPSYISDRVVEVRERNAATGRKYGIDPDFVRMLYSLIIYQSCAEEDIIKHKRRKAAAAPRRKKKA